FGKEIHAVYGGVLKKYEAMHLLQEHSGRLALTRDGISVSNVILADFLL
ncbi:MAG TPA: coproporphyrinogen III oxidase, partial [Lachnospiraceae bacterium]|nr:coproporphyrinogen III oxidase [Lachnospiraceae bacterium]